MAGKNLQFKIRSIFGKVKAVDISLPISFDAFDIRVQLVLDTIVGPGVEVARSAGLAITADLHVPEQGLAQLGRHQPGILVFGIQISLKVFGKGNISLHFWIKIPVGTKEQGQPLAVQCILLDGFAKRV